MIAPGLTIATPASIEEAVALLARDSATSAVYAGGTELVLAMKQGLLSPSVLVDVKRIPSLAGIALSPDGGSLLIGAGVTHAAVIADPLVRERVPILASVLGHVGNVRIRNAGTPVGNLCFADPHSDVAVIAVVLETRLRIAGPRPRVVPAEDFLLGPYETSLAPGELVEALEVPLPTASSAFGYARRRGTERPIAAAGVRLDLDAGTVRAVVGAIGGRPYHSSSLDAGLGGLGLDELEAALPAAAHEVAVAVEVFDDYDASPEYRRHLAGEMFLRAARQALEAAR